MDDLDIENRRIALDRSTLVGMRDGAIGNAETIERAEAYLSFLTGTAATAARSPR
jgi:hypothetical protein